MKKIFLSLALVLTSVGISAAPRSAEQALLVAKKFIASTARLSGMRSAALTLAPTATVQMAKGASANASTPSYYVCNIENGGFVVVSGDDRFKEVLGYSLQGTFTSEQALPDGLRYWLSFLSEEMNAAIEAGYEAPSVTTPVSAANPAASVEPLIKSKWAQDSPYNNLLAGNMTGCVATGTAQVMRFWQYPTRGIGSHTGAYSPNFSADFGATTYDWKNMLNSYGTGWESKAEVDAVATLMLHVGVATDMRWGTDQSGTPNAYAAYALINYFGYNKNLYIENRDQMSLGAWKELLIDQLQTGHPLCYSGMDTGSVGHFFVCDGYDAETDKFHFNWGWAGQLDGYYDVTSLEPGTGGIGAGVGKYNSYQTIFVNVQPQTFGEPRVNFTCQSIKVSGTSKTGVVVSTVAMSNDNTGEVKGNLGLAVYDNSGNLVKYIPSGISLPLAGFHIGAAYSDEYKYIVNVSDIPAGTYMVAPAAKSDNMTQSFRIRAKYDEANFYKMEITATGVKFSPLSNQTDVTVSDIKLVSNSEGNIFQNCVAEFEVTVTNNSALPFNDEIGVKISKGRTANAVISVPASLAAGETKTITVSRVIPKSLNLGDGYTAQPCYGINGAFTTVGNTITVNVKDEASSIALPQGQSQGQSQSQNLFNLAGQKVNTGSKGIVIKNGKKLIIK